MTQVVQSGQMFRIHVIAASPAAPLAILSIAGSLGIGPEAADNRASLPSMLADDAAGPDATRLSALLTSLGFQVRPDPALSLPTTTIPRDRQVDLAFQVRPEADMQGAARRLSAALDLPVSVVAAGLTSPRGLVLHNPSPERLETLQRSFRRDGGLRILSSDPRTALYDGFERPGHSVPGAELQRLGIARCAFSGSVATGVNAATARHLARRTGDRIVFVNRDFQRYDLFVTAAHGLAERDLAGFLDSRRGADRAASGREFPRRTDTDLPRHVAERFATDYAAIGLDVQARLRGRLEFA